ncbi:MAG: hypothetical protein ACT4RN_00185 [Pseudonocardia sp.]
MILRVPVALLVVALVGAPAVVVAPEPRCVVADERLAELSGLVADAAGVVWAIADGGRRVDVHRLDVAAIAGDCPVRGTRTARIDPRDAEDLGLGPDGALWVADIGDNERARDTVAVVVLPSRGEPRLHRLAYPDGPHDAEALIVTADGVPVIVTKDAARPAGIYRTERPPSGEGPTPLVRVGSVTFPPSTTTGGPLGGLGSRVVTGAAATGDRRVVALRSYTDAWLYAAPDGDVVAALTGSVAAPLQVPLPGEPQGEAITFLPDGTLLSGSETRGGAAGELRAVPGVAGLVDAAAARPAPDGGSTSIPDAELPAWLPAVLGVATVGAFLLVVTLAMVLRRR